MCQDKEDGTDQELAEGGEELQSRKGQEAEDYFTEVEMFGRPAKRRVGEIGRVRALTQADLDTLQHGAKQKQSCLAKLRESHHKVAFLLAEGRSYSEVAQLTNYSYQRIMQYANDPMMKDLIAQKREQIEASVIEVVTDNYSEGQRAMNQRLRQINDKIEADQDVIDETGEFPPMAVMRADFIALADRFGFPKTTVNQNENTDFAAILRERRLFHQGKKPLMLEASVGKEEVYVPSGTPPPKGE